MTAPNTTDHAVEPRAQADNIRGKPHCVNKLATNAVVTCELK